MSRLSVDVDGRRPGPLRLIPDKGLAFGVVDMELRGLFPLETRATEDGGSAGREDAERPELSALRLTLLGAPDALEPAKKGKTNKDKAPILDMTYLGCESDAQPPDKKQNTPAWPRAALKGHTATQHHQRHQDLWWQP